MTNVSNNPEIKNILVVNNNKLPVESCGEVNITSDCGKNVTNIVMENVLHVPTLATNLLSVSQLIDNGNRISFKPDMCYIYNQNNRNVATATVQNGIYK